jgi:hypothetical protein
LSTRRIVALHKSFAGRSATIRRVLKHADRMVIKALVLLLMRFSR